MPLTAREAFRLGFLTRCAEDGLDGPQLRARVKLAFDIGAKDVVNWMISPAKLFATAPLLAAAAAIPVAAGLGTAAGYTAGQVGNNPDVNPDEIKRQELAEAYRQQAEIARIRAALRQRPQRAVRGPRL